MKTLTYDRKNIDKMVVLLNQITITGITGARIMSAIADIIDTGMEGEIVEKEEKKGGMDKEEVRPDKLAE